MFQETRVFVPISLLVPGGSVKASTSFGRPKAYLQPDVAMSPLNFYDIVELVGGADFVRMLFRIWSGVYKFNHQVAFIALDHSNYVED